MSEQEVLQFIHTQLSKTFVVERMILFGSRGRGTAGPDSDYDVLVIANSEIPFGRRQGEARIALGRKHFPLDLFVYTPAEAAFEGAIPGSTVFFAEKEGKIFNAQA